MTKKLGSIIALGVVALIALVVVILYVIPVNYAPNLRQPNSIIVQQSSTQSATVLKEENKKMYDKIMSEFNDSLTRSLLSAIFAGQNSGGLNISANGVLPTITTIPNAEVQIQLTYSAQDLVINNKTQPRKITSVIYQINDTKTYQKTMIYFEQEGGAGYYQYATYAMQSGLYDYITSLTLPS